MNNAISERLVAGDEAAFEELILSNTGLAMNLANEFARSNSHLKSDLEGEALLALVQAADQLRTSYRTELNVTSYLYKTIKGAILDFLDREGTVAIPARTRQRARSEGRAVTVNCKTLIEDVPGATTDMVDMLDEIQACATTDSEKQVADLLVKGFTAEQIADQTGLAVNTVLTYTRRIHNRFVDRSLAI